MEKRVILLPRVGMEWNYPQNANSLLLSTEKEPPVKPRSKQSFPTKTQFLNFQVGGLVDKLIFFHRNHETLEFYRLRLEDNKLRNSYLIQVKTLRPNQSLFQLWISKAFGSLLWNSAIFSGWYFPIHYPNGLKLPFERDWKVKVIWAAIVVKKPISWLT